MKLTPSGDRPAGVETAAPLSQTAGVVVVRADLASRSVERVTNEDRDLVPHVLGDGVVRVAVVRVKGVINDDDTTTLHHVDRVGRGTGTIVIDLVGLPAVELDALRLL